MARDARFRRLYVNVTRKEKQRQNGKGGNRELNEMGRKIHLVPDEKKSGLTITADMIQATIEVEKRREEENQKTRYLENFGQMSLLDIYSSDVTRPIRRGIKELLHEQVMR